MTLPASGFSFAVSGMISQPAVFSSAGFGRMSTLSDKGFTFIVLLFFGLTSLNFIFVSVARLLCKEQHACRRRRNFFCLRWSVPTIDMPNGFWQFRCSFCQTEAVILAFGGGIAVGEGAICLLARIAQLTARSCFALRLCAAGGLRCESCGAADRRCAGRSRRRSCWDTTPTSR